MYFIALCDDEMSELDKTERVLGSYGQKHPELDYKIERFMSAEELLYLIRERGYMPDLIIMDIYMPDMLGIDAAKELRDMGNRCKILFLTRSKEHALDAFGVEAVQYLVKPVSESGIFSVLDKLIQEAAEACRKYILLRIEGRIRRVAVDDIVSCEAQGKMQRLYFTDGTQCELRMTMAQLWEQLSPYCEFIRAGAAYIINMEHIDNLKKQELLMDNGRRIYPPRGSYQNLRERYFEYFCEGG